MAVVRISGAITSINTATTGVQIPTADIDGSALITVTAAEATALCQPNAQPSPDYVVNLTTGTIDIAVADTCMYQTADSTTAVYPLVGLTINGNAYVWSSTDFNLSTMLPADAAALIAYGFKLVTG